MSLDPNSYCSELRNLASASESAEDRVTLAYQCLVALDLMQQTQVLSQDIVDKVVNMFGVTVDDLRSPNKHLLLSGHEKGYVTAHGELIRILDKLKFLPFKEYDPVAETAIVEDKVNNTPFVKSRILPRNSNIHSVLQGIYEDAISQLHKLPPRLRDEKLLSGILSAIGCAFEKDGVLSVTEYQAEYMKQIAHDLLFGNKNRKVFMIDSPTGSGKTEILLFATLLTVLALKKRAILIYPRKALEEDQVRRILSRVEKLRECMKGITLPTILVVDGDHKRRLEQSDIGQAVDQVTKKKIKCPRCNSDLVLSKHNSALGYVIRCSNNHLVDYLRIFKDDVIHNPDIIVTNRYILITFAIKECANRNCEINVYQKSFFNDVALIIVDEAHAYINLEGGDFALTLKSIKDLIKKYSGEEPWIILSSATVPNPVEFASKLAQVDRSQVFYTDYNSFKPGSYRANIVVTTMPTPRFSAETLFQLITLASMLWLRKYGFKGLAFVDSRVEVNRMYHYLYETILGRGGLDDPAIMMPGDMILYHTRRGAEYLRKKSNRYGKYEIDNDALWDQLVKTEEVEQCLRENGNCDLVKDLRNNIKVTHAWDPYKAQVFDWFKQGGWKFLLSTSTLELGIDIPDISLVVQYKPPIRNEGFIQRIGRAGRDVEKTKNIALGILVLSNSIQSALYMYDEHLRRRLIDIKSVPPYKVNDINAMLQRRHALYHSLMLKLHNNKRTWYPIL